MPVVKAKQAQVHHQSAIVMDLSDLEQQAGRIVADARAEAARLVAAGHVEAAKEAEKIREDAREAGQKEGYQAGFQEGQKHGHDEAVVQVKQGLDSLTARWSAGLDNLQEMMPAHAADAKTDLVRLALAIAARVTHEEGLRNKAVVGNNVRTALELVGAGRTVAVHVHPDELALVESYLPDLLLKLRNIAAVEVKEDSSVTPGGCVLRYGAGEIDARLETQVTRIANELLARQA